jgi:hypothetical protein
MNGRKSGCNEVLNDAEEETHSVNVLEGVVVEWQSRSCQEVHFLSTNEYS